MDARREGPSGARRSTVFALQADPPEARHAVSVRYSAREPCLRALGVSPIDLRSLTPPMMRAWADVAPRYAGRVLRRFAPAQRYALTAWCVVEAHQTSREHVVARHDQRRTKQMRAAQQACDKPDRELRRHSRRGVAPLIATGATGRDPARSPETPLATLLAARDASSRREAVALCTERHRGEERGEREARRARAPGLRRDVPAL